MQSLACQDGGEAALKGIREFFGSREAELEKALEAQKIRQEKIVAEMERQTEEMQQKMEAQLAAEVRQGEELRDRIEALQETYTSVSDQLEMSQLANEKLQVDREALRNDVQRLEEMLKEEKDLNEQERKAAEEEAKKKQEELAKLEEKQRELSVTVRELDKQMQARRTAARGVQAEDGAGGSRRSADLLAQGDGTGAVRSQGVSEGERGTQGEGSRPGPEPG
ncbi:unnamed protein product [Durusdinium trenchii]|uniref:Uncharacterized protein n=1 Tax=Durusdinium trenchii TaxID=1381693 RepID=A0ABP0JH70_9DINO